MCWVCALTRSLVAFLFLGLSFALPAAGQTTVSTGDSLTNGYFPHVRGGSSWDSVAVGGADARRYVGIDPHGDGTVRDLSAEVLAHDPDTIVFLLGTNDATHSDAWFHVIYVPLITGVFDAFEASGANVVVITPIPILQPGLEAANQRISELYAPWLRQQAANRGFVLLDLWTDIQFFFNWEDLYGDGVHLFAQDSAGFKWMAARVEWIVQFLTQGTGICLDGIDNDGDGFVDLADTGCDGLFDSSELASHIACDDGIDNDGDGLVDFRLDGSGDPVCVSQRADKENSACQDGINNDPAEDEGIDFDGGVSIFGPCVAGTCPPGVSDLDGDGVPEPDQQCVSFADDGEMSNPVACGLGAELALLVPLLVLWRSLRVRAQSAT